jgi:UDPglucose 6-dehydrogenase
MNKNLKKILIIGNYHLSYVYSACLSNFFEITYINTDSLSKVQIFDEIHNLREPGLHKLFKTNLSRKKIFLDTKKDLRKYFDLIWITIDFNKFKNKNNFCSILNKYINRYKADKIVISTQVELGTLSDLSNKFKSKIFFYIPENLRFGKAIFDFNNQSRTVIGSQNGQKDEMVNKILSHFDKNILWTNFITSESLKMTMNLLIASQISISNELMRSLTNFDNTIDIKNLFKFIFADNRLKKNIYYNPGTAIYGETLLRESNKYNNLLKNKTSYILKNLPLSNLSHKQWFIKYLKKFVFNNNKKKIIAFYGLQKIKKDDLLKSSILSDIHSNFKNDIKNTYIINDEKPFFKSNTIKFIKTDYIDQINIDLIIILDKYEKNINKLFKNNPKRLIFDPFMIYKKGIIYGQK